MADQYERWGRGDQDRYGRGVMQKAGDEVRSWFGDDEAARRRARDEREEYRYRDEFPTDDRPSRAEARDPRVWREGESRRAEVGRDEPWSSRSDVTRDWAGGSSGQRSYGSDYGGGYATAGRDASSGYRSRDRGFERASSFDREPARRYGTPYGVNDISRTGVTPTSMGGGYVGSYGGWTEGRGQFVGRGPKGYRRSDERIREDLCDRLTEDPAIDASDIEITVNAGEVTLSGFVHDREDKRHAEDLAERISGVREVHNSLRINRERQENPGDVIGLGSASETSQAGTKSTTPRR